MQSLHDGEKILDEPDARLKCVIVSAPLEAMSAVIEGMTLRETARHDWLHLFGDERRKARIAHRLSVPGGKWVGHERQADQSIGLRKRKGPAQAIARALFLHRDQPSTVRQDRISSPSQTIA